MKDRRRNKRSACHIQAEFQAGPGFSFKRPIIDISEDGAFGLVQPSLQPGERVTLRFRHPWTDRLVQTRAVVARRVLPGSEEGPPGLGLYFVQGLTELGGERRSGDRTPVDTPARIAVGQTVLNCRLVQVGGTGAAVELDLGLKRQDGGTVPSTTSRKVLEVMHRLRSGTKVQFAFRDPSSYKVIRTAAVIARTPTPVGDGRPEYHLGLRFEVDISSTLGGGSADAPPHRSVSVTRAGDLDQAATRELQMRSLLRSAEWSDQDGGFGEGRLVLAGPWKVLVACRGDYPAIGQGVNVILQTPTDSNAPPLGMYLTVTRSGGALVAGSEPGFVGTITGFVTPEDEERYNTLVGWLTTGLAG